MYLVISILAAQEANIIECSVVATHLVLFDFSFNSANACGTFVAPQFSPNAKVQSVASEHLAGVALELDVVGGGIVIVMGLDIQSEGGQITTQKTRHPTTPLTPPKEHVLDKITQSNN